MDKDLYLRRPVYKDRPDERLDSPGAGTASGTLSAVGKVSLASSLTRLRA